jgi:hypothetical protein
MGLREAGMKTIGDEEWEGKCRQSKERNVPWKDDFPESVSNAPSYFLLLLPRPYFPQKIFQEEELCIISCLPLSLPPNFFREGAGNLSPKD